MHFRPNKAWLPVLLALGALPALILVGCATIMHGTTQGVNITSTPSGATVMIDRQPQGTTPVIAKLSRKDTHILRLEMKGYEPYEMTVNRSVSGWVWGNIVFGGLVGLAVDAISGGLYKLTPEQINASLKEGTAVGIRVERDHLYMSVVLKPSPEWQKVGSLTRSPEN